MKKSFSLVENTIQAAHNNSNIYHCKHSTNIINKLDSFGQALRMTDKVKELINLSTYPLINFKPALTLAEVLITLGIIGVVAAMTIPTLMTAYLEKQTVTRLKRTYSILQQAIKLSEAENGEVRSWRILPGDQFFETYLADYIKYLDKYTPQELWDKAPRKCLDGNECGGIIYGPYNSTNFSLLDGTIVSIQVISNAMWIGIDTNGLADPNMVGKDTFLFTFTTKYGLRPFGDVGTEVEGYSYGTYSREKVKDRSNIWSCSTSGKGYWCSALIMNDGWKMESDYPWQTQ